MNNEYREKAINYLESKVPNLQYLNGFDYTVDAICFIKEQEEKSIKPRACEIYDHCTSLYPNKKHKYQNVERSIRFFKEVYLKKLGKENQPNYQFLLCLERRIYQKTHVKEEIGYKPKECFTKNIHYFQLKDGSYATEEDIITTAKVSGDFDILPTDHDSIASYATTLKGISKIMLVDEISLTELVYNHAPCIFCVTVAADKFGLSMFDACEMVNKMENERDEKNEQ